MMNQKDSDKTESYIWGNTKDNIWGNTKDNRNSGIRNLPSDTPIFFSET